MVFTNREEQYLILKMILWSCIIANDEEYSHRIDYLRKILIKELEGREEGYSDGNQLIENAVQNPHFLVITTKVNNYPVCGIACL